MREIKFKGIRVANGEWVYGDLVHYFFIKIGKRTDYVSIGIDLDFYDVIPETVGQFTGLKDKNGIDIYEGDIVRHRFISNGILETSYNEVYFDNEMLEFGLRNSNELFHCQFGYEFEVIGNIHDNPELLK